MKRVFIGHRGVGKTELLKRHSVVYFPEIKHFDLDQEIEKTSGVKGVDFFKKYTESEFRKIEVEIFQKLISKNSDFVIALGAGFNLSVLPKDVETVFIRRTTDKDGRIFLNRPRLEPELGPIEEFKKRYESRHPKYIQFACQIYDMPEGHETDSVIEKMIMTDNFLIEDAYYTLCSQELCSLEKLIKNYKNIELRTDLLEHAIIQHLLNSYPKQNWLISIRSQVPEFNQAKNVDVDYKYYFKGCQIVSSHAEHIEEGINQLNKITENVHLKLSPIIENFEELINGYNWQQVNSASRSFLPRSKNGKWIWYRELAKYMQKINFIRNFTEILDQPSLTDWLLLPEKKPENWAAVLGESVYSSRSPLIHQKYFFEKKTYFTKIAISTHEFENYYKFLIKLGLKFAAVTAPLKKVAFKLSAAHSHIAEQLQSVNTLFVDKEQLYGHNTDFAGFTDLVQKINPTDSVAIWGGGGTLNMMKSVLPQAQFFSSRTAEPRDPILKTSDYYDYLIWAAPRSEILCWPSNKIKFGAVIDLNYSANSLGLEFAMQRNIDYVSGLEMFATQALQQQLFWSKNEC